MIRWTGTVPYIVSCSDVARKLDVIVARIESYAGVDRINRLEVPDEAS